MRFATVLASLLLSSIAFAGDGDEVLAKVEKSLSNFEDQEIKFSVSNLKPGKSKPESMAFTAKVKGPKSYTEFTAPGDIKGTRVLTLSPTQMWVYLPEYGRVRRVASHATEQGFMGTTLTQQDMAPAAYTVLYDAKLLEENDTTWTLELTPKDGVEVAYKRLKMVVEKDKVVPTKIEYYSDKGEVARTETRGDYTCKGDYCLFGFMKMEDHTRGAWTELRPVEANTNVGLSDSIFSQRTLQLGE
jgi:outer membrane lipoprotein-sorting protein